MALPDSYEFSVAGWSGTIFLPFLFTGFCPEKANSSASSSTLLDDHSDDIQTVIQTDTELLTSGAKFSVKIYSFTFLKYTQGLYCSQWPLDWEF